jgi:HK97 family phage prohead protease
MDKSFLTVECQEKKLDVNERSVTHYISKKTLDRGGDIVLPDSIDDKNYKKNPIVLFNHNGDLPVGKSLWRKSDGDGVLAKTQFATTPLADDVYQLNKEGVLNAWSIGFIPRKWEFNEKDRVTTFTDIELLEYSSVSVPMNQDAVTEALKMVKTIEVKEVLNKQIEETKMIQEIQSFKKELKDLRDLYNQLLELTSKTELEDLEKAERKILELEKEIQLIKEKLSVGTLDKKAFVKETVAKLVGDVS